MSGVGFCVIGHKSLNTGRLANFFDGELWDALKDLPLNMYFQLDGASNRK